MVEVIVFGEGPTEEKFIKALVAPALRNQQIFVKPQLLNTSKGAAGGAFNFDRLKLHARNTLRQNASVVLSTFIDLYALDTSFPGFDESRRKQGMESRVAFLCEALHQAVVNHVGCRPERFIAHIQPYEFEGLLFSDPEALVQVEPGWHSSLEKLRAVRDEFPTPEHINNSYEKKPSRRLETLLQPRYKKTRHGALAAQHVTLSTMERECAHFRAWMDRLRALGAA
jgi:hypothetical protein